MHDISQTLCKRVPDSPGLFIGVNLLDEFKESVSCFIILESRSDHMGTLESFDPNNIDWICNEGLPDFQ